jgi:four helix bundle protein
LNIKIEEILLTSISNQMFSPKNSAMEEKKYDLEDRLIDFAARIMGVAESLPNTRGGNYLASQMVRCGVAPSLLYGEAQGAESRDDFIHKMKIVLKELKETRVCLKLIKRKEMIRPRRLESILKENEELIAIIAKSIDTAKANNKPKQN